MTNLEIILVNDFSNDETLSIIEQLEKEDQRIKVINNKKNMGILYSRSIGALGAKGKYLFPLDSDDMVLDKDVYSSMTTIADKGQFDIVGFRIIFSSYGSNILTNKISEYYYSGHPNNKVLFQPELGNYPIRPGKTLGEYKIADVFLYNKCIKAKIYQKALIKLGEEKYSRFMTTHEDLIATCFLFNTAESMKYVGKYGILHIQNPGSTSWKRVSDSIMNSYELYVLDTAIDFTKDNFENKKLLIYLITHLMKRPNLKETFETNEENKKLFISCLNKILNNEYFSKENKEEIKNRTSKIDFLNRIDSN